MGTMNSTHPNPQKASARGENVKGSNSGASSTAILDRILYRCEVIKLEATESYRMKNRKTIFGNDEKLE